MLILLLLAQLAAPLTHRPGGLPNDLPKDSRMVSYARADLGKERILLRFFTSGPADDPNPYVDVLRQRKRTARLKLEWHIDPSNAEYEVRWLRPGRGPMVTLRDSEGLLVLLWPDGLGGRVHGRLFSCGSSSLSATQSSCETASDGTTVVVEELSEPDTPLFRRVYRWTKEGWKEQPQPQPNGLP